MTKKALDFMVIGAQKAGTTSLFEYLRTHPRIYIPLVKEAPFFSRDERYEQGWEWYVKEFFPDAPEEALWGTVSPQYMSDPVAPARIHGMMPDVKLIALLRNPIYRALSHHKMAVRWEVEERSFDQAVGDLVQEERALSARARRAGPVSGSECYLAWGEYARVLGEYRSLFPEEQMLVLFSEDLERAPQEVLRKTLKFLEISTDFMPANLGKRYHVAGTKRRIRSVYKLREVEPLMRLWRTIPERRRRVFRRLYVKFNKWNTIPDPPTSVSEIEPATLERLVDFYRPEVERLRAFLGREVPWPEFR